MPDATTLTAAVAAAAVILLAGCAWEWIVNTVAQPVGARQQQPTLARLLALERKT
ncbi:hypothetical protein LX32DRAFT_728858 [Colletotrichum zoysiae]|uniref:Uncharacterized protein n=1 Tax=Colletotrichum zoysiae TaxID=1216348 RepID=A0AAD9M0L1_9PEZI|nr:hypothetical protein LX32DRAFT_728858 [Colletotrichum zoysiae]